MASPALANNTIALVTGPANVTKYLEADVNLGDTVYPGMFLGENAAEWVFPNPYPGTGGEPLVALENPYSGGDINTPYTSQQHVMMRMFNRGDEILTKVSAVNGGTLVYGGVLYSDTFGWLTQVVPVGDLILAYCLEQDNSPVLPRWTRVRIA